MDISSFLTKLLYDLSEENYDRIFSTYRFWIEIGVVHGSMPNDKLYRDILNSMKPNSIQASYEGLMESNTRPDWINPFVGQILSPFVSLGSLDVFAGKLIHDSVHLLLRFITDAELDPIFSTHAIGLHDRFRRESLEEFFKQSLRYIPDNGTTFNSEQFCEFYTRVNLIAHWANLGYVGLEDVRGRILQSLTFQPTVHPHQLNSLMILLKISGATFAAYVDPSVMDRCCDLLNPSNLGSKLIAAGLAKVGANLDNRDGLLMLEITGGLATSGKWLGRSSCPSDPPQRIYYSQVPRSRGNSSRNVSGAPRRGGTVSATYHTLIGPRESPRREPEIFSSPVSVDQHRHPVRLHDGG